MKVKNVRPDNLKKGAVYEVPCRDCGKVYIGEMGGACRRGLKNAMRNCDMKNSI